MNMDNTNTAFTISTQFLPYYKYHFLKYLGIYLYLRCLNVNSIDLHHFSFSFWFITFQIRWVSVYAIVRESLCECVYDGESASMCWCVRARGRKKEVIGKICPCFLHLKSHIINRSGGRIQSKSSAQTFDKKIQSHDADIIISL